MKNLKAILIYLIIIFSTSLAAKFVTLPKDKDLSKLQEEMAESQKKIEENNKNFKRNKGKVKDVTSDASSKKPSESELSSSNEDLQEKEKEKDDSAPPKDSDFTDKELDDLKNTSITAVGDSVFVNVDSYLREYTPNMYSDSEVSRHFEDGISVLQSIKANQGLGEFVIYALGSNGDFDPGYLDKVHDIVKPNKLLLVSTVHTQPREDQVNRELESFCKKHDDVYLIDRYKAAKTHPEYFAADKLHPNKEGCEVYSKLAAKRILEIEKTNK